MRDRILAGTNVPRQFRTVLLDDYDVKRGEKETIDALRSWKPTDERTSLLLWGLPGYGKTMTAAALLNERHADINPKGPAVTDEVTIALRQMQCPCYFIQMAEWVQLHIRQFSLYEMVKIGAVNSDEWMEIDRFLEDLKNRVQFLVVDDVGKEHITHSGFAEDTFDLLVRTRHNNGLTTIFTSNLSVRAWSSQYSDSMQSFVKRSALTVEFH